MGKRKKNNVQKLIGFEKFTKYGIKTDKYEFVFFMLNRQIYRFFRRNRWNQRYII